MNIEEIREYCLEKKGVEEGFPFGSDTLVFKVAGKMFLLMSLSEMPPQFNAKCDPAQAIELREKYSFIIPGYHMNKNHWNTIVCRPPCSRQLAFKCIDQSYDLVVAALPRKKREALKL
jgi:predicted DNA-binding protein (MmcQ/YjbR family)